MNKDKMKMQTPNRADDNFRKLAALFPNAVTETTDENGDVVRAIDKDALMQEISTRVVEGREERYQFTWPDKRKSVLLANAPINKTLRPCREDSKNFDATENLYIEGDNLEVLKLLQETYLGKIKMIYIDPPYNTGKDFVYADNFAQDAADYKEHSGQLDEAGNRLFQNTETNGRFHTDWLNMIYPRLKIAKDLLTDDGVIFISISEEEIENLKKVCNEVFGQDAFVNSLIVRRHDKNLNRQFMGDGLKTLNVGFEYILCYSKLEFIFNPVFKDASEKRSDVGYWKGFWNDADRPTMRYDILGFTPSFGQWKWGKELSEEAVRNYQEYVAHYSSEMTLEEYWEKTGKIKKFIRRNPNGKGKNAGVENWIPPSDGTLRNTNWTDMLITRTDDTTQGLFDFPKNVDLIRLLVETGANADSLILDFFSGSATTAHAVMQLNAEDGGKRKFILVQVPEATKEESEAFKAGYKNICEIGKERIRRAGEKIKAESPLTTQGLDVGFRVLKCDSSNMKDVYYTPDEVSQDALFDYENNIKDDRSAEDLLFQVMLDLGVELSSKIEESEVAGKKVYRVADGFLMACFDKNVTDEVITAVAKGKPYYFVMRDSSLASDSVATNFDQIFKTYSPDTVRKVL